MTPCRFGLPRASPWSSASSPGDVAPELLVGRKPWPNHSESADTGAVGGCCDQDGYDEIFGDRFARRVARRCRKRGLDPTRRRVVDFLVSHGIEDATILEIGGGIGELHLELLRRGARAATNLEISNGYEQEASLLLDESGLGDRVTRRFLDIATSPYDVEPADVVVLHRVVCCYPDYNRLLSAAASHARQFLVFSHPPRTLLTRSSFGFENLVRRLRRNDFRVFVHPPEAMVAAVEKQGMVLEYRHPGLWWSVVAFGRPGSITAASRGSGR